MTTLYLTEPGTLVRIQNQTLIIQRQGQSRSCRMSELDLVVILPGVQLTHAVLETLMDRGIETLFMRQDGGFRGRIQGQFATNPAIRMAQYQRLGSPVGQAIAIQVVLGKVQNQRVILQRQNRATRGHITELSEAVDAMSAHASQLVSQLPRTGPALTTEQLMGIEGICGRLYFQGLRYCLPSRWNYQGRSRQPPMDPVNALLSWGYGVLLARMFSACVLAGLDPYLGFFHAVQPYRPNLVLDMMEEFRPVVVDVVALQVVNERLLDPADFEPSPEQDGIWLGGLAKKVYLAQLEERLRTPMLYPPQNRKLMLSQIMLEQARLLARCLQDSALSYEAFELK
ncbi:MAG: CRISPR-associated endonuclease Cas1 [Synechococcaceae cyanobacterium SM2_3_2]|nr:CRISPR-associated endonuclease Cas1 [Synechococcaceae cyanobacterium SM2_3_2]